MPITPPLAASAGAAAAPGPSPLVPDADRAAVSGWFEAWPEPCLIAEPDGSVRASNPAYQRWAAGVGVPAGATLGEILNHRREDPTLAEELREGVRQGRTWTGRRRYRRFGGQTQTVRIRALGLPGAGSSGPSILVQIQDLSPDLDELGAEADRSRTDLLLDLLGSTTADLAAPAAALHWLAELRGEDLERVPEDLRRGLLMARRGARRLEEMFGELRRSAGRWAPPGEELPEEILARVLVAGAQPWQTARLLDELHAAGLRCVLRVVAAPAEAAQLAVSGDIDVVLTGVGGGEPDEVERAAFARLRGERPELPVLDLRERGGPGLAAEIRAAARRRLRQDATAAAWRRMEEVSLRDPLTGLLNRRAFDRFAQAELRRARRYDIPIALAIFDLDHFKELNDQLGHPCGDRVLASFAAVLASGARESDLVARLGGDEFAILMPHTDGAGGLAVAERIRRDGEEALRAVAAGVRPLPGVSVGLRCAFPGELERLDDLVRQADAALYRAKRAGRGCCAAEAGSGGFDPGRG